MNKTLIWLFVASLAGSPIETVHVKFTYQAFRIKAQKVGNVFNIRLLTDPQTGAGVFC